MPSKKRRILNFLDEIDWLFAVNNWEKTISFEKENNSENRHTAATITPNEKYQRLKITIFPEFFTCSRNEQRKILLHELCHILVAPMLINTDDLFNGKVVTDDQITFAHERVTTSIENILDGLLQGRLKYAKAAYSKYLK